MAATLRTARFCPLGTASGPRARRSPLIVRATALPVAPVSSVASVAPLATVNEPQRISVIPQAVQEGVLQPLAVGATTLADMPMLSHSLGLSVAEVALSELPAAPLDAAETASAADAAVETAARLLLAPYNAYVDALEKRPLLTKALTSFVGFMLGDVIAQQVAHHGSSSLDMLRVLRLGVYGLCLDGPIGSVWYDWLEAHVNPDRPTATSSVLIKTALDQVVYASISTAVFFAVITLLEGHPQDVASVVQAKFMPTLAANYAIWPLAHIINFRFVPSSMRITYNNCVAIGWLALLSAITHSHGSGSLISHLLTHIPGFGHHHC